MNDSLPARELDTHSCSYLSRQAGEPLFATATQNRVWLLLEYPPPWGSKALNESTLPDKVKSYLSSITNTIPSSRLQFIYSRDLHQHDRLSFFIGSGVEPDPFMYEITLHSYEELLDVDIPAILAGIPSSHYLTPHDSLFLVCTNGKRDPCCARIGLPVYRRLHQFAPESTWQTIHVGGHRFAANTLWLPHGLYFGRITVEDVPPFLDACQAGKIYLPNYRGRSSYPPPAQAAEYFLRSSSKVLELGAYHLVSYESILPNRWQVILGADTPGERYSLMISEHTSQFTTLQSCRDTQPETVTLYSLESLQHISSPEQNHEQD